MKANEGDGQAPFTTIICALSYLALQNYSGSQYLFLNN